MKPKITPTQLDLWSGNMSELYNSLEGEIIKILIKRLNGGHKDISSWQAEKLYDLHLFNDDVIELLAKVTNVAEPEVFKMFQEAGKGIVKDIDGVMPFPTLPLPNNLDNVMRGYSNQTWSEINNYVNQSLITTSFGTSTAQLAYQNVLNQTSAMFNTGLYTFNQSLEKAVNSLAQKGISSFFVDKGGHQWSLEAYTRTVLKSTLSNTYNAVRTERMSEYGVHTVVVTTHAGAREACSRIQGNVVDLRSSIMLPEDSEYKSIYDPYWQADYEAPGGHRGVNCKHLHIPFIPGVSTNNQPEITEEVNEDVRKARDTQRRYEREIVKYKKNLMVAENMGSENVGYWKSMVAKRQKAMRDLLNENPNYLRRNYGREKVYTPLDTLLKDFKYDK